MKMNNDVHEEVSEEMQWKVNREVLRVVREVDVDVDRVVYWGVYVHEEVNRGGALEVERKVRITVRRK